MTNLPPWLQNSLSVANGVTPVDLLWRFSVALLLGWIVTWMYRGTHRSEPISPTFPRTLVLLSILIAMVTSVIGDNVALAFSLVGALSIVRFRTVVRDTQDTAFVIFAVVLGMAAGANHLWVALVGLGVIGVALLLLQPRGKQNGWLENDSNLVLRVTIGKDPAVLTQEIFARFLDRSEVLAVSTAKQGTALEVNYGVRLKKGSSPGDIVGQLARIEGVQNVDLRQHTFVE
jgi:hypothetical protein